MELRHALRLIDHPFISPTTPAIWADLGAGRGLFTYALASKLAGGSKIFAVDKQVKISKERLWEGKVEIENIQADFTSAKFNIGPLDGILMANSLHFVSDKNSFITQIRTALKDTGCFLIVEYDMSISNKWVPYPIGFQSLKQLFSKLGYQFLEKIQEYPSKYQRANIYSVLIK